MSEDAVASDDWKAPYLSYETFTNFFDKKLAGQLVPPRIDTHFLDTYAGSVRPQIMATLRAMGMIGEGGATLDALRLAAQSPSARQQVMREWAQTFYHEQLALAGQAATAKMLWDTFAAHGYSGSTLRKAVVFYLALVEELGLPNSPHFRPPKAPPAKQGASAASRRASRGGRQQEDPQGDTQKPPPPVTPGAEVKTITLGDAGTVTVTTAVRWLDLPDETFIALRKAIRDIESLAKTGVNAKADDAQLADEVDDDEQADE